MFGKARIDVFIVIITRTLTAKIGSPRRLGDWIGGGYTT